VHLYHEVSEIIFKPTKLEVSDSHSFNHFLELYSIGFTSFQFLVMFQEKVPLSYKNIFGIFHGTMF